MSQVANDVYEYTCLQWKKLIFIFPPKKTQILSSFLFSHITKMKPLNLGGGGQWNDLNVHLHWLWTCWSCRDYKESFKIFGSILQLSYFKHFTGLAIYKLKYIYRNMKLTTWQKTELIRFTKIRNVNKLKLVYKYLGFEKTNIYLNLVLGFCL